MALDRITTSRSFMMSYMTGMKDVMHQKAFQMASGKVADTYGGIGTNRLLDLELTQRIERIGAYEEAGKSAELHLKSLTVVLERMEKLRIDSKSAVDPNNFVRQADGSTRAQKTTSLLLREAISMLNRDVAGYYLFGGETARENPVASIEAMLDGKDGKDGLRAVLKEYEEANLGAAETGRLNISAVTTVGVTSSFSITEDGAHDFGFDLQSVTSSLTGMTLTAPTGADPDSAQFSFSAQPVAGEKISLKMTLPPAHTESVEIALTATDSASPAVNQFAIGATPADTAGNFRTAITNAIKEKAASTLKVAADKWAANEFFKTTPGTQPQRISGIPATSATALVPGGSTTVKWYTGENSPTNNPRNDKKAIIDQNLEIGYGIRANEKGLADIVKSLATFVAAKLPVETDNDKLYAGELATETRKILHPPNTDESGVANITTDIALSYRTLKFAQERHQQLNKTYNVTKDEIEGVNKEVLATEILQMKTNIEASYKASSIIFQLNLSSYI